ncbi:hypothetical protein [Microvirga flavescens]|uniref:hypothetical protein n=1 Tax=Microvirga flavescens TaxID=2249811 RepID=UPI000DD6D8E6|nr:hypothetical protein [Microvirga flavescens]
MIYRLVLSAILGIALVVSLSLKFPGIADIAVATAGTTPRDIATLLERHDFEVRQDAPDTDLRWVSGRAGTCSVLIAPVAPQGWHRSLIAKLAGDKRVFYVFEGQIYAEQPILRTRAHYYWSKFNRYLGLSPVTRPVIAVIATPGCENVPVDELAALSAR